MTDAGFETRTAVRPRAGGRFGRDTLEFTRVVNLSDALFAIAMTLLAFEVEAPPAARLASELADIVPQALAFLLSFAVVTNFWWHHHGLFSSLEAIEPRLLLLNFLLLGAVALVPVPTELVGRHPGAVAPAVLYLTLMLVMTTLNLLMVRRAERAGLWRSQVTPEARSGLLAGWAAMLGVTLAALLVALWWPLAGVAALLLTGPADHLARLRTRDPETARRWRLP